MSDDLVMWLRTQLDEDERVARATTASSSGIWHITTGGEIRDSDGIGIVHTSARLPAAELEYIARHDPARALREVDAKRRILDRHGPIEIFGSMYCTYCGMLGGQRARDVNWPCPEILDAALPYADRPGYRDEWRP